MTKLEALLLVEYHTKPNPIPGRQVFLPKEEYRLLYSTDHWEVIYHYGDLTLCDSPSGKHAFFRAKTLEEAEKILMEKFTLTYGEDQAKVIIDGHRADGEEFWNTWSLIPSDRDQTKFEFLGRQPSPYVQQHAGWVKDLVGTIRFD